MAITDLQISDTLQTSAPSIKYTGNEGPQAPQRMASQPDPTAEMNDFSMNVFGRPLHQLTPRELESLYQLMNEQSRAPQQDSGIMKAAYGGMMRQKYGLGKFVRKLIPNEIAAVAEKAAPFVAPFNPLAAGLMGGIGSFDRTGNLMGSAARGLGTYGLGQGARFLGGAELQPGLSLKMPGGASSGIGQYFSKPYQPGQDIFSKTKERFFPGKEEITEKVFKEQMSPGGPAKYIENLNPARIIEKTDTGKILKTIDKFAIPILLGSMGIAAATAKPQDMEEAVKMSRGTGLDIDVIRKEVQDALAGGEEAWAILQQKYPYVGEFPTKKAEGGRIGLYAGGVPSPYSMEDARKTSMQDKMGGITDVMKRADLFRSGDVGQMYRAQGGRIGYRNGIGPNQGSPGIMSQAMTDTEVEDAFGVTLEQERAITDQQVEDAFGISVDDTSPVEIIRYKDLFRRLTEPRDGQMGKEYIKPIGTIGEEKTMTPLSEQSIYQNLMLLVEMFKNQGMNDADALDAAQSYFGDRGFGRAQGGRIGFDAGKNYEAKIKELMDKGLSRELAEIMVMSGPSSDRYDVDEKASGGRIGYKDGTGSRNRMSALMFKLSNGTITGEEMIELRNIQSASGFSSANKASGGRIGAEEGGIMDLGGMEKDYRNDGGFVPIGEYEKKDDVPARLSKNEFVFTADAVRGAGGGDIDKGAEMMENMMKHLEQGGQISEDSQGLAGAQEMFDVSERLGEVI